jgi:hypothetical protein
VCRASRTVLLLTLAGFVGEKELAQSCPPRGVQICVSVIAVGTCVQGAALRGVAELSLPKGGPIHGPLTTTTYYDYVRDGDTGNSYSSGKSLSRADRKRWFEPALILTPGTTRDVEIGVNCLSRQSLLYLSEEKINCRDEFAAILHDAHGSVAKSVCGH